ncbi:MAG: type II toxin-antitoxin system prevent-host-death family antitoxin [Blastocatellia bacterium]
MQQIDIQEINIQLYNLIESLGKGEEIVITKNNSPIAKLVPYTKNKPKPQFGSAKGLITISEDFDEPLEDFSEYMK